MATSVQSRVWWNRLERRAVAAYEMDLLTGLRQIAHDSVPVIGVDADPASSTGVVRLRLPGGALTLAGVTPFAAVALTAIGPDTRLRLADGGRYGQLWWVELADGERRHLLTGSHLRLARTEAVRVCPAGRYAFFSQST